MLQFHHLETALSATNPKKLADDGSIRAAVVMPIFEKNSKQNKNQLDQ